MTMSSIFSSYNYFESLDYLDINCLAEVEWNKDTLAYDDNAYKAVLCAHSLIFCLLGYSLYIRGFTEVEENNSNDTLACDDNAQ